MESPRPRAKWLLVIGLLALLYWLALLLATHIPMARTQNQTWPIDKFEHLGAFAGLALLLCFAASAWWRSSWRIACAMFFLIAIYGAVDEVTQSFIPGRSSDIRDWLADITGATIGILCFAVVRSLLARSPSPQGSPPSLTP